MLHVLLCPLAMRWRGNLLGCQAGLPASRVQLAIWQDISAGLFLADEPHSLKSSHQPL